MSDELLEKWQIQVRKGLLELCVLNALSEGRQYGYDVVKKLRLLDGLVIGEGTIYPILSRFKAQGLVDATLEESPDGPARKYYRLTPLGKRVAARMNEVWDQIQQGVLATRGNRHD